MNYTSTFNQAYPAPLEFQSTALVKLLSRPKTRKEVAAEYNVHPCTLKRWLQRCQINKKDNSLLTVLDLRLIYDNFGIPVLA
ncbi:helix-turn-helix domain-containing protein [Adhaeribacter pallidiroseus]|uniref:Uncharacterized protein n=1 Tax=Adhaeribacter pallidiroseus TaxID=2072847 RepID=A0A369QJZ6_9BACT|nr:helix-turn-helix domain-containing protein [Adhaeribacter pallidiroseus]RDC65054.1 hypothetical protein AHMF7616_03677 [Adhaeribacter pallidiroseus]